MRWSVVVILFGVAVVVVLALLLAMLLAMMAAAWDVGAWPALVVGAVGLGFWLVFVASMWKGS